MENKTQPPNDEQFDLEKMAKAYAVEKFYSFIDAKEQVVDAFKAGYLKAQSQQAQREKQVAQAAFEAGREQVWSTWGEHPLPEQALWIKKHDDFASYWAEQKGEG